MSLIMNISLINGVIGEAFSGLLSMSWIVILLLTLGIIFCIVEAIIPGFGFFGITGILCEIAGIVYHGIVSKDPLQVFILILILTLLILIIFLMFVRSAKYGVLGKSAIVENKSSLPENYGIDTKAYLQLVGKVGVTLVGCRPIGKAKINGQTFEVIAKDKFIDKDENIKVLNVDGSKIYIDKTL